MTALWFSYTYQIDYICIARKMMINAHISQVVPVDVTETTKVNT